MLWEICNKNCWFSDEVNLLPGILISEDYRKRWIRHRLMQCKYIWWYYDYYLLLKANLISFALLASIDTKSVLVPTSWWVFSFLAVTENKIILIKAICQHITMTNHCIFWILCAIEQTLPFSNWTQRNLNDFGKSSIYRPYPTLLIKRLQQIAHFLNETFQPGIAKDSEQVPPQITVDI